MDDQLWLALVEAARRYAQHFFGDEVVSFTLNLRRLGRAGPWPMPLNGHVVPAAAALVVPPTAPVSAPPPADSDTPETGDTEAALLAVLARCDRPLKARTIAHRAGRNYSSHIREILAQLVADGRVVKPEEGGYWLASRPLPRAD